MIEKYISFDGTTFYNKQECIDHENNIINREMIELYNEKTTNSYFDTIIRGYINSLNDNFITSLEPVVTVDKIPCLAMFLRIIIRLCIKYNEFDMNIEVISRKEYTVDNFKISDIPDMIKNQYDLSISYLKKG